MPVGTELYKRFLATFKKGMNAEAQGNYGITNKTISDPKKQALGKYQFVPLHHWKKIQDFAASKGYGTLGPKDYQAFLDNKDLQESYFEHYVQVEVFPFVEKHKDKSRDLSLDELGAYYHFEPLSALNYIKTGQDRKATAVNPDGKEYIKRYTDARKAANAKPVMDFSPAYVDKQWKTFNTQLNKLNENKENYSEELIAEKRMALQEGYQREGLLDFFNKKIEQENKATQREWLAKDRMKYKQSKKVLDFIEENTLQKLQKGETGYVEGKNTYTIAKPATSEEMAEFVKKIGPYAKYFKSVSEKGNRVYRLNIPATKEEGDNIFNAIEKTMQPLSNNENFKLYDEKGEIVGLEGGNVGLPIAGSLPLIGFGRSKTIGPAKVNWKTDSLWEAAFDTKMNSIHRPRTNQTYSGKNRALLVPIPLAPEPEVEETPAETQPPQPVNPNQPTESEVDKYIAYEKEQKAAAQTQAEREIASDFFSEMDTPPPAYDPNAKYKDNFPFADVLSQAAGIVTGLSMADDRIPYRDEQVNDDFRDYAAKLAKISERGLSPEEEGYAKRMLTEAYQGSYDRIVQASNGNRNLVLGNAGRVDFQRNQGLMDIALADAKAKNDALYKYGEAMKYINEFDASRDIANNERKYQNTIATKEAGGKIAGAAMSAFVDTIQTYQDNKPGSYNHMYESHMSKRMFGIDTTLKDDGSGTDPYTPSYEFKKQQKLIENYDKFNGYRNMYSELNAEEKSQVNKFIYDNPDNPQSVFKIMDEMKNSKAQDKPFSTAYGDLLKTGAGETAKVAIAEKAQTDNALISANAPAYNEIVPTEKPIPLQTYQSGSVTEADKINAETEKMKSEGQSVLDQSKIAKEQILETMNKTEKGLIDSEKGNQLIGKMIEEAKSFIN